MLVYLQGGRLDGRVVPDVSKKQNALNNKLDGENTEWYRKTGKKVRVAVEGTKGSSVARVYRFDKVVTKKTKKDRTSV